MEAAIPWDSLGGTQTPSAVPSTVPGADVPPQQLGQGRHHPRLPGFAWWHTEQLKSASPVGEAGAPLSATPSLIYRLHFSWV